MKRLSFVLGSALIIVLTTFFLLPVTFAQDPPPPPDISGTWEFSITNVVTDWYGEKDLSVGSGEFEVISLDNTSDPNILPNYLIDLDGDDDFIGFVHDGIFAFYKQNQDNCGGTFVNFGHEIITGKIRKHGAKMVGKGMGFDSKPDCGGIWSYTFEAQKITE